jgi:hypothetical protein
MLREERPITGAIMKPWPMKPHARVTLAGSATRPTMGSRRA